MIRFYSGTPGSGKSLHVASDIYRYLQNGKNVIANFEINDSLIKERKGKQKGSFVYLSNSQLMENITYNEICSDSRDNTTYIEKYKTPLDALYYFALNFHKRNDRGQIIEKQTLLVIDEAQIIFNSRSWQSRNRQEWVTFFTQHRKYGYEVIIVSQFQQLIDKQIRGCFEFDVMHRKVMNYKSIGFIFSLLFRGNLFVAIEHLCSMRGKQGKTSTQFIVGKKKYFDLYNSYKIFEG